MSNSSDQPVKNLAKAMALLAVRNTCLEDLHNGVLPASETGDYTDVKVVTPHGEIPWNELSRLNDEEMKRLMKQVVNKLYTCLHFLLEKGESDEFAHLIDTGARHSAQWDEAELDKTLLSIMKQSSGEQS